MIGGNVFSIAFGRNLDAHNRDPARPSNSSSLPDLLARAAAPESDTSHQCLQGRECYASSLLLTIAACTLALALCVYAGWKDYRQVRRQHQHVHAHGLRGRSEVVWDAGND